MACYRPNIDGPSSLVCSRGHTLEYPAALDAIANAGTDLAFCIQCDCQQVHMVALYGGDSPRVVKSGDLDLYARFENSGGPSASMPTMAWMFSYRDLEPLDLARFLKK